MATDSQPPQQPQCPRTATWGAQHFDRAPTKAELKAIDRQRPPAAAAADGSPTDGSKAPAPAPASLDPSGAPPPATPSVAAAVKTIRAQDFLHVYQIPCAREGFLTGIGSGAVVGMLRYIVGGQIPRAANWAVGAFAAGGIVAFEVCQASRRAERAKMKRVVEVYDRKQQADAAAVAAAAQKKQEEAARRQREEEEARARRRWYKFW